MPKLAFHTDFFAQLGKLQRPVRQGVLDTWRKFERLTLTQLFADRGLNLEALTRARDKRIRTVRIDRGTRGVVLAPERGETFVLLRVLPHDKAIEWATQLVASVNTATSAVELRDEETLDEITPAYESMAPAPEERLFAKHSDGELRGLGIDDDTLRRARLLRDMAQLQALAPHLPQDQVAVLELLAEGHSADEIRRLLDSYRPLTAPDPVDTNDLDTAIGNSRHRIAFVEADEELREILGKPFAAWRVFLHPAQHVVAYRPSYSGSAQVTGGPGTGKTVVALHRVKHLLEHLPDGERILLTTYTKALVSALRTGLETLVEDDRKRDQVEITTVDALANRIVTKAPGFVPRDWLHPRQEERRWKQAASVTGCAVTAQFLSQEYRHVVLARNIRSLPEYQAAERKGRGSALPRSRRPEVWRAIEEFKAGLADDGLRTWLQTCAEAADLLESEGPVYRHVVVDEAQDLHPAQWRLLRAAVPEGPDDLFIAGDPHQRVYDSKVSLKELGIKVAGRSARLRRSYRSTQQILSWSVALLTGRDIAQLEDEDRKESLHGYRSALSGTVPAVGAAESEEAELDALVERVRSWTEEGVELREIGVSTRFNKTCKLAVEHLKAAGIAAVQLRSDAPESRDAVRVGTMHSFKGLEFRCVAVIGVSDDALPCPRAVTPVDVDRLQHETDLMAERCLLFVACTRARDSLYVSWSERPSRFLTEAGAGRGGSGPTSSAPEAAGGAR